MVKKAKSSIDKKIAARKEAIEKYEQELTNLKESEATLRDFAKLVKNGKMQPVHYWRPLWDRMPSDTPVDLAHLWNWMVKFNSAACRQFHAEVTAEMNAAIAQQRKEVARLKKAAS